MAKEGVTRGTRKRFETYITDLDGNGQDPDSGSCKVAFTKSGEYTYDSPQGPFACKSTGAVGWWGYDWYMPDSITLGDWIARFTWTVNEVPDAEDFLFTIVDLDRPWLNRRKVAPATQVVE